LLAVAFIVLGCQGNKEASNSAASGLQRARFRSNQLAARINQIAGEPLHRMGEIVQ